MKHFCLTALFALFVLFFGVSSVHAQERVSGGISISPSIVDVVMEEGEAEKEIEFVLENNGEESVLLELFSINFRQVDEYGRLGFLGREAGEYSFALSSFLTFDSSSVRIDPGKSRTIVARVTNRSDLSPGGHYAAVVARLVQEEDETVVSPAISSLVFLRKSGGEQFNLSLKDVDWPRWLVEFTYPEKISVLFQNQGNVHLTPFGKIEVKDIFGRMIYEGTVNTNSSKIFPLSRRYIPARLQKINTSFPISLNSIEIRGQDSLKATRYLFQDTYLYVHPGVLILFFAGVAVWIYLRRKEMFLNIWKRVRGLYKKRKKL